MSEVAVKSSVTESNAGDSTDMKEADQGKKQEEVDTSATNGHAADSSVTQPTVKKKDSEVGDADKSTKKTGKEKNNADETKSPAKRKAKAAETVSDENEKDASPAKKKAKRDSAGELEDAQSHQEKKSAKSKAKPTDDEDEDDEDEEEIKPGLLERPIVLEEGVKREKKKVQRLDLTPTADKTDSGKKIDIAEGSGEKLGDLPRVELQLQKTHCDDLKPLHRLLYERMGSAFEVKKNIRRFSGFPFSESSPEYQKKKEKLARYTNAMLKSICEILDVERKGNKEEIIDRIVNFLMKPHSSGKSLPKKKRRSSLEKSKKSKSKKSKSAKSKKKQSEDKSKNTDDNKESGEDSEESDDEKESGSEGEKSESEDEDASEKKKKVTKKTPTKSKKEKESKTPKSSEKSSAKKTPKKQSDSPKKKRTPKKAKDSSDESDEDDEPLVKKGGPPTDDVLRDIIKKILKTANLEEVTMKTVCKQVYDKFPEYDLTPRKDFIKTTVKQILK